MDRHHSDQGDDNTNKDSNSEEEYHQEKSTTNSRKKPSNIKSSGVQSPTQQQQQQATAGSRTTHSRPKPINTASNNKTRVQVEDNNKEGGGGDDNDDDDQENLEGEENDETFPLSPTFSSPRNHTNHNNNRSSVNHQSSFKMQQRNNTINSSGSVKYQHGGSQKMNNNNENPYSAMKNQQSMNMQKQQATSGFHPSNYYEDKIDLWGHLLIGISYFFLIFSFPFSLCACLKVAQEYERAVIFRLGRILKGGAKGPGIFFVLPCIDTYTKVDLRTVTFDVPPQEILTKDSVTVSVDAVVYFRIFNAVISVINVEDAAKSTKLLAASTLRNILGTKSLHEILSDRESVAILIQNNLDEATGPWGVKVERVEVKDVRLPVQLQRAMATEAEAAREARAKVIAAEGEQKASKALKEAAEVISESPIAIQLRYLQTLTAIASEKNSTIVFPIPLEMLSFLANKAAGMFKIKT